MSASNAEVCSSFNFFTVSLPMWFSLLIGSSRLGISCFFKFLVRLVTTYARFPLLASWLWAIPCSRSGRAQLHIGC